MDGLIAPLLFFTGIIGGIINALAGGATLITFPVMLAAGLAPVVANASNAVAIAPGHLLAAIADREKLPIFDRRMLTLHALCVLGGVVGALVLLALPDRLFVLPVPGLIGFATLLFAFAPRVGRWAEERRAVRSGGQPGATAALFVASIYGGFFGAGLGIILTAVLSIQEPGDIRKVKVMKNLLGTCVSLAAIAIFIVQGMVQWPETLAMLSGAVIGGYAGGHLVRVLPGQVVRLFVIVSGAVMTCVYAGRYWF